jgi:hypothetical protein
MATEVKVTIRLPAGLHAQLVDVAQLDQRSMNREIIVLLEEALEKRRIYLDLK